MGTAGQGSVCLQERAAAPPESRRKERILTVTNLCEVDTCVAYGQLFQVVTVTVFRKCNSYFTAFPHFALKDQENIFKRILHFSFAFFIFFSFPLT